MNNLGSFSLAGKYILVTGASSGIGRTTAQVLSKLGANIVAVARNEAELKATVESLAPGDHKMFILDITSAESRNSLVDNVAALDGLVHCAGVTELVPFRLISEKHLKKMMETNFEGPVYLTQRLLYKKKIKNNSSIIGITSTSAQIGPSAASMYSASKAALEVAFRSLGAEVAGSQIRVNLVSPGYVETNLVKNLSTQLSEESIAHLFPLGKLETDDVSHTIAFLLSDASRWITRANLKVDSGLLYNVIEQ